ncbi:transcriptional regulatory protein C1F7.11c [Penicillium verhagenii]|uniref:transcriptional regulatory protein C1F7.11c n=1 Tax=Penicillium verhagenii TaxID=1562060 RepID=UPI002545764E|nr:transcriptional regulatory protein C1F7.11c [Penicillium verhagenii]KAJ5928280.1 transcriptional regulatory protein C1F7.11c [Penicillium verhagenii]
MSKNLRKSLSSSAPRACINCQKRKTRCFRAGSETDPCSYCARKGKTCSFESPPDRTPLTRRNLDASESRCAQLRSLLRSLKPDFDIEAALEKLSPEEEVTRSPTLSDNIEIAHDSYEWHEGSLSPEDAFPDQDNAITRDGMATLSTNDSGYLGSSSGSRILEEIDPTIVNVARQRGRRKSHRRLYRSGLPPLDLPSLTVSQTTSHLIDAYFLLYNSHFPVLHEKTFRDRVAANQQQASHFSPWKVTYYMVLAIGHWASSKESDHLESNYYSAARSSLSLQMLESGTVETVQAFLLMGNYLQKRDRTNTGYNFIGLAYRMAIGLGLHREPTGTEDTIGHERRRQLFWTIYCFESGFNITTGRPPTIVDGFIDIRLPRNVDDKVPTNVDYPTTYSAIIAHAQLAKLGDAIYHEFLLAKTAGSRIEYRLAESMERDLLRWCKSLPSYFTATDVPSWFRGPRAVVLWKKQNLRILLWRGSQTHHSFLSIKVNADEKCLNIAMDSIHDIATFCTMYESDMHQSLTWYATYFLLQATLVLVAGYLDNNSHTQPEPSELHHSVFQSRNCLRMLAADNKSAARYLEMLDVICSQVPSPAPDLELDQYAYGLSDMPVGGGFGAPVGDIPGNASNFAGLPSENDFMIPDENLFALNDDSTADPNLRMLINQVSQDFTGSMPLDLLFNDWMNSSA